MHNNEQGFTLVELMVVVVIIAVLIAIAIPIYTGIQLTAAESAHDANVRTLKGSASIWSTQQSIEEGESQVIMSGGSFVDGTEFGDYIEGSPPKVPELVQNQYGYDEDYIVTVYSNGAVDVVPGLVNHDS